MTHNPKVVQAFFQSCGLPVPVPEYRISQERRFRWDWAFVSYKILLEINGGVWKRGKSGHSSGTGIKRDMDKLNFATSLGWRTIAVEPSQLLKLETAELVRASILAGAVECRFLNG